MKKRIFAVIAAVTLAVLAFAAGYEHCYLRILREAEFYVDREMIMVVLDGEWNEVFLAGEWEPEKFMK